MPHVPQPPSLKSKSLRFGNKDPKVVACSEKMFLWEIIGVMVQMMEVRFRIRKTPFFGTINPEKMINRIFYLNNPPNNPSSSEYSLRRLFNFEIVKLYPAADYLTPR
jgi:hypothetical protein